MLIIQRHLKQSFYMGENYEIEIKVLCVHNGSVILGVEAPKNIPIYRIKHEKGLMRRESKPEFGERET